MAVSRGLACQIQRQPASHSSPPASTVALARSWRGMRLYGGRLDRCMNSTPEPSDAHTQTPRRRFRELLARPGLSIMPGGFSPLYARMAEAAGFESFFVAGSQTSAFLYGVPDMGLVGLRDMVDHTRHVQARVSIPILVDADTGYGNATNVFFAVQEFGRAGVAGLQIEDQEAPKKSATMAGRRVIPARTNSCTAKN